MSGAKALRLRCAVAFASVVLFEEPHDADCECLRDEPGEVFDCDCWKSRLRTALDGKDPYA